MNCKFPIYKKEPQWSHSFSLENVECNLVLYLFGNDLTLLPQKKVNSAYFGNTGQNKHIKEPLLNVDSFIGKILID